MKRITKLVAVSAAAMTFGITGVSALNNTNVVNADSLSNDNSQLTTDLSNMKHPTYSDFGADAVAINKVASQYKPGESVKDVENELNDNEFTAAYFGYDSAKNAFSEVHQNWISCLTDTNEINKANQTYNDANKVLADLYNQNNQPVAQNTNNANVQNANNNPNAQSDSSNKKTDVAVNKQNTNDNVNAQNSSSNKKADVVANANNNNAKKDNAQGAVANKQTTNNEANAQQNTVKSNANVEGAKTVANENESNSAKNQNNGAIAETQNENTTAAGETSTVVKAQAKSANNSAAQKNNTPVFPQTGEQTSEILAVAGGLIIAATAAGIVVYKKRN